MERDGERGRIDLRYTTVDTATDGPAPTSSPAKFTAPPPLISTSGLDSDAGQATAPLFCVVFALPGLITGTTTRYRRALKRAHQVGSSAIGGTCAGAKPPPRLDRLACQRLRA